MTARAQDVLLEGSPIDEPWQALLEQGVQLLKQPSVARQQELLMRAVAQIAGSDEAEVEVKVWLAPSPRQLLDTPEPLPHLTREPSVLMRRALKSGQLCGPGQSQESSGPKRTYTKKHGRQDCTEGLEATRIAIPLVAQDENLGAIELIRPQGPPFSQRERSLLSSLGTQAAIAMHTSCHAAAERKRIDQFSTLAEVSRAVASILDLDALLNEVVTIIHRQFDYPFVHLYIVDSVRKQILFRAGCGPRSLSYRGGLSYDLDAPEGIIPWVARHGKTVIANDVDLDPRYRAADVESDAELLPDTRAELTVPLAFGTAVLGVLDVQSDHEDTFDDNDRFLFEAMADSVAIAIRNANLYHSERWRRQVADSLHQVAGLLSADAVLEEVLDTVLAELERTLPCDLAAVWLLEEAELHVAAIRGPDLYAYSSDSPPPSRVQPDASTWVGQALDADRPIIRTAEAPPDPLGEALDFPYNHSAIAAPLRAGGQELGLLTLAHRDPGRYGAESQAILRTFASYAAVAIENARLFQESQEQALISTVMLRVAEASQSLAAMDQILESVVELASQLTSVRRCAILLWEDAATAFVPAAAYGLDPAQQSLFDRSLVPLGDVPAMDRLLATATPSVLYAVDRDPSLSGSLISEIGLQSPLLLPLLSQGEVLGVMLVECQDNLLALGASEVLLDQRLVILQGISHQAAAAVENARLREAQQAEAYVSAALLQVSQTINDFSALDDILAAIVRITPMLVGVDQCLLYVWEERKPAFRLVETYGLSPEQEEQLDSHRYRPGEFGLLDQIRAENLMLIHPLAGAELMPDRAELDELLPPTLRQTLARGHDGSHSLLAIPLSVKGEVLGAMLLVEPQSLARSRERRVEIITGIAQQAALAVQNDRLQSERLGRERLERELQLAREIQQTFIPRQLPRAYGWDMAAVWRAAREVAGDFYDVIELPDRRLGLIVADVADKGMPAALLMALTRTLVRATAVEETSPAALLERVNNLLVPDAHRGMFVTAFYAVICLESGTLTYANAGHCQPIVRPPSGALHTLPRGGMALGVLSGLTYEERSTVLVPGDGLVLYSDGVTEAFSPQGEMYGEERLLGLLESGAGGSAQAVLDTILASVHNFSDDADPTDDLTLLVLHRTAS